MSKFPSTKYKNSMNAHVDVVPSMNAHVNDQASKLQVLFNVYIPNKFDVHQYCNSALIGTITVRVYRQDNPLGNFLGIGPDKSMLLFLLFMTGS